MRAAKLIMSAVSMLMVFTTYAQGQDRTIKFDLSYSQKLPVGVAQKWLKVMREAGAAGIRLSVDPTLKPSMREEKIRTGKLVTVYGKIGLDQKLQLPGRSFGLGDADGIRKWIQQLQQAASIDPADKPVAFGLTPDQLVKVHGRLSKPFPESTRNQTVIEIVRTVRTQIGMKISADTLVQERLQAEPQLTVPEEMEGLSCGTVLAAVIRPLGLVFRVAKSSDKIEIVDSRVASEHWPIGWPPQKRVGLVAPVLLKHTEVDIEEFPLGEVLGAIEAKIEIPFVFDQNNMARHGIEINKVTVSIPQTKTFYEKIIRRALAQTKPRLVAELRVDEAGSPFLWVSTPATIK